MDQISSLLKRPKDYYNIDGVGELGIGFMCLAYSLLGWLQLHNPPDSVWRQMYTLLIYVGVMGAIIHHGSKAIKDRITYRRTGFVDYSARDKYWTPLAISASVSIVFSAGLILAIRRHWEISSFALVPGLFMCLTYIRIARTVRWKWAVFGVLVSGALVIAALPSEVLEAFANRTSPFRAIPAKAIGTYWITFLFNGIALMVSGGISFALYLHHTQAPAQEEQ